MLDLVVAGSCQREGHVYIVVNGERSRSFGRCNLWIAVKGRDWKKKPREKEKERQSERERERERDPMTDRALKLP